MKLKIQITMDNAAFEPRNGEVARILLALAGDLEAGNCLSAAMRLDHAIEADRARKEAA